MANFIHWPSKRPIYMGDYEIRTAKSELKEEIGVGWCSKDLDVELYSRDGITKSGGKIQLLWDKANKTEPAYEVPLLIENFDDGDIIRVIISGTKRQYSTPLRLRRINKVGRLASRQLIASKALAAFMSESHYLWGSAGNVPNGTASKVPNKANIAQVVDTKAAAAFPGIKKETDLLKPDSPFVYAAYTTIQGLNVCAGRCDRYPAQKAVIQADPDYLAYLAELQKKKMDEWGTVECKGKSNLTPRAFRFKGGAATLVFGESCLGRQHFDCVGLVNYSVGFAWKDGHDRCASEIYAWMDQAPIYDPNDPKKVTGYQSANGNFGTSVITDNNDLADGDLVGQFNGEWHHIGLLMVQGEKARVIQASDTEQGLTMVDYVPSSWSRRTRISETYLFD